MNDDAPFKALKRGTEATNAESAVTIDHTHEKEFIHILRHTITLVLCELCGPATQEETIQKSVLSQSINQNKCTAANPL
jgi:hypothetical protein